MTKIIENFTGIDVSKKSFNVAIEKNGKVQSKEFLYTAEGMKSCLSFIPDQSRCIIESTGTYHCRLACYLTDNNVSVSVVNPLSVKRFAQALMSRTKTDKADCRMLIEYGKHFDVKPWQPQESCYIQMRQLLNLSSQLIKQQTALENQLEAIEHSFVQSPVVINKIELLLQTCRDEQNEIEKELEKLVKDCEKENFDRLKTIPGIGKKTAIVLIVFTQGMKNFDSAKQISSYFGLCPRIYESGTSVKGKARICKMGMAMVRKMFYLCALSAKKHNRACRELYDRLVLQGKSKKLALIAVANKLLKQAFSIIMNKSVYVDNFFHQKFAY